jgi:hypothetical protein
MPMLRVKLLILAITRGPSWISASNHMRVNMLPDHILMFLRYSDVWETGFIRQLSGSQTFHVFETPPTKVYVP